VNLNLFKKKIIALKAYKKWKRKRRFFQINISIQTIVGFNRFKKKN
jgi:hypothetical protein